MQFNLICLRFIFQVLFDISCVFAEFLVCLAFDQLRQIIDLRFIGIDQYYNVIRKLPCALLSVTNTDLLGSM